MRFNEFGSLIDVRFGQKRIACSSISVTGPCIVMDSSELHRVKRKPRIRDTDLGMMIDLSSEQREKAPRPRNPTDSGMLISSSAPHRRKAQSSMSVTVAGIETCFNVEHP